MLARKGEKILRRRQEWLVIAERYGHAVASSYEEGGELMELVNSSSKKKRLLAAIQAEGSKKRSPPKAPVVMPSAMHAMPALPQQAASITPFRASGRQFTGPCHRCGQLGHYIRDCPVRAQSINGPLSNKL